MTDDEFDQDTSRWEDDEEEAAEPEPTKSTARDENEPEMSPQTFELIQALNRAALDDLKARRVGACGETKRREAKQRPAPAGRIMWLTDSVLPRPIVDLILASYLGTDDKFRVLFRLSKKCRHALSGKRLFNDKDPLFAKMTVAKQMSVTNESYLDASLECLRARLTDPKQTQFTRQAVNGVYWHFPRFQAYHSRCAPSVTDVVVDLIDLSLHQLESMGRAFPSMKLLWVSIPKTGGGARATLTPDQLMNWAVAFGVQSIQVHNYVWFADNATLARWERRLNECYNKHGLLVSIQCARLAKWVEV